ncbi:hypothetical protein JXO59_05615, partial [candidate division KSB1 bacterium]|nr:hypothetical protein [candidate division KSB1 bacterium]
VHYDASDATPLTVILAGHYLRAAGDVTFIKSLWPSLLSAMDFLYRTDTNGDGLIENTNVGHGWIEGGKLYGSHTELYLAALWAEALREAACMAKAIGEDVHANGFGEDADKIRLIINQDFYNDETGFYNLGLLSDGTYRTEPTVMPTVPMLFGLLDENRVAAMLKAYAGNTFSTDWGVRILSAESPLFNPRGYHYGSVWPLFTGWTALAEYRYGNSVQGFTHLMANLNIFKNWALGFSEEVSHGTVYRPGGVCSHQCWSETNALHPIISGMLGWQPDAVAGRAVLRPRMPLDWDWLKVERLCIGATKFSFEFSRQTDRSVYNFWIEEGPDLEIELQPEVPPGMTIEMVSVGGKKWTDFSRGQNGLLEPAVTFKLRKNISVEFQHHGGVGMVPFLPNPAPEDSSMGVRIIDQRLDGKTFKVCVEGRAGREGDFRLRAFTDEIDRADGLLLKMDEPGMYQLTVLFPAGDKAFVRKEVGVYLK